MHPESSTILRLFRLDRSVNNSLDYIKRITPPDEWMNGIASYTMWWIKIQHDLYCYSGDKAYLSEQMPYLKACVQTLGNTTAKTDPAISGSSSLTGRPETTLRRWTAGFLR